MGEAAVDTAVSTPTTTDANTPVASSTTDDNGAKPQAETTPAKPKSMLDAIKAAVARPEAKTDSPSEAKTESTDPKVTGEEGEEQPPPFHQHPRWKALVTRNRNLESKVTEITEKGQRFDQMQAMMQNSRLSPQEVDAGFNIMALMKNDPFRAREAMRPYWEALQQATGAVLPPDVKAKVDNGLLPEIEGRELAETRARNQTLEADRARSQQESVQSNQRAMAKAVSDWEQGWKTSDPDYAKKQQLVEDRVQVLLAQGAPRTVQDAIALAERAKADIETRLRGVLPTRSATTAPPPAASSVKTAPKPASMLEAMKQAAAGVRVA